MFLLGLRVGSNGGAGGSLLRLALSAKSPALSYKQLQRNKETCLQLANYNVHPSWVGACFLQHKVLIMTESLYAGLISVALFVSYSIALYTHPMKAHFSLLCLCLLQVRSALGACMVWDAGTAMESPHLCLARLWNVYRAHSLPL